MSQTPIDYAPKGFISKMDSVSFGGEVPFTAISDKVDFNTKALIEQDLRRRDISAYCCYR